MPVAGPEHQHDERIVPTTAGRALDWTQGGSGLKSPVGQVDKDAATVCTT
jgi:hypothetical protein